MGYVLLSISENGQFTRYDIQTEILEIDTKRYKCQLPINRLLCFLSVRGVSSLIKQFNKILCNVVI